MCIISINRQRLHLQQRDRYIEEERESSWSHLYYSILLFKLDALNNIGLAYEDSGDIRHGTEYLYRAIYLSDAFEKVLPPLPSHSQLPPGPPRDWESGISKAKHSLGTCFMKLRMPEEAQKYLSEDLQFSRQLRSRAQPHTEWVSSLLLK